MRRASVLLVPAALALAWAIVFTSQRAGIRQLYLMNADGTRQRVLSGAAFRAYEPSWR